MRSVAVRVGIVLVGTLLVGCASPPGPHPVGRGTLGQIGPDDPRSLAGSRFSIHARFLLERGGDPYARIIDKSDGPLGRNGWALGVDAESGRVHLYAHDGRKGGDFASRLRAIEPGRWHEVTAVARRSSFEIWIDGKRDADASFEEGVHALPGSATTPACIGNWNHAQGRAWKGLLDDIAVWNRDLEPEEILEVHRRGLGFVLRNTGARALVAWWRVERE